MEFLHFNLKTYFFFYVYVKLKQGKSRVCQPRGMRIVHECKRDDLGSCLKTRLQGTAQVQVSHSTVDKPKSLHL